MRKSSRSTGSSVVVAIGGYLATFAGDLEEHGVDRLESGEGVHDLGDGPQPLFGLGDLGEALLTEIHHEDVPDAVDAQNGRGARDRGDELLLFDELGLVGRRDQGLDDGLRRHRRGEGPDRRAGAGRPHR